jgi:hypothetical protein
MATPLSPGTVRRVTDEDKAKAKDELGPFFQKVGAERWTELKTAFARRHGLTVMQVDLIVLELRRKHEIG